jgi:GH15 family glucan-1,4-alpha-glucosidase
VATDGDQRYPRIDDYAFLGDGIGVALVSTAGSIDWACLRRIDAGSAFGRLLDWDTAGYCRVAPTEPATDVGRCYVEDSMVLQTTTTTASGTVTVTDLLVLDEDGYPAGKLLRVAEGVTGEVELRITVAARYDYGQLRPWVREERDGLHTLVGGDDGLLVWCDARLDTVDEADLVGTIRLGPGDRCRLLLDEELPHLLDAAPEPPDGEAMDRMVEETVTGWRQIREDADVPTELRRSALVLRALGNADTGAIAAAATTSLPEVPGGDWNWDYRYTWIRDSWLAVRSLADLGDVDCADRFRRFVERSAAGQVDELQIAFGVGGEHDLFERTLDHLEGWRGCGPVRIGNAASTQVQLDAYGSLLELAWLWYERGHEPDDDWWRFLCELVDHAADHWDDPDHGIWEIRDEARHYVHSKVFAWVALDRGLKLGEQLDRVGEERLARWQAAADACRSAILERGVRDGHLVEVFDDDAVDAALLLIPSVGFLPWDDPLMVATVDAVRERLVVDGFVRRHEGWDDEGAFLPCSFWMVECLAHQGRLDEAQALFDRVTATANDVGLFAEEWDTRTGEPLGNYPQALTHLSHITAALALRRSSRSS